MGDDFDLFPKRESLDPFSFGTKPKEKEKPEQEQEHAGDDDLFFGQEPASPPTDPTQPPVSTPGEPVPDAAPLPESDPPAAEDMPGGRKLDDFFADGTDPKGLSEETITGPIPDDQSGYDYPSRVDEGEKFSGKRRPSPFVTIGGALLLILVILYGVLTYLQKGRKPPVVPTPPASVTMKVPGPARQPAGKPPGTASPQMESATEKARSTQPPVEKPDQIQPDDGKAAAPKTKTVTAPKPPEQKQASTEPAAVERAAPPASTPKAAVPAAGSGANYSVQIGAFILKSSVNELEKRLSVKGYDPLFKEGFTSAVMHFLSVGPFSRLGEAREALDRLRRSGLDVNLRTLSGGGGVINAGSFLVERNARKVMDKIRRLGYPVRLTKKETRMPMTFVRVGAFNTKEEALSMRGELKGKGFDAIVVRLQ